MMAETKNGICLPDLINKLQAWHLSQVKTGLIWYTVEFLRDEIRTVQLMSVNIMLHQIYGGLYWWLGNKYDIKAVTVCVRHKETLGRVSTKREQVVSPFTLVSTRY